MGIEPGLSWTGVVCFSHSTLTREQKEKALLNLVQEFKETNEIPQKNQFGVQRKMKQ